MAPAIGELGVDLVGDHHDVRAPQHLGQGLQILPAHHAAGGVVGIGQHQQLCAGGDGRAQLVGGEAEVVLGLGLHRHGHAVGHGGERAVAHKGGSGDDDLVPHLQQAAEAQVQPLAAAHGDQNLADGGVLQVEPALHVPGDLPAQVAEAGVGGVFGKALLQRVDTRVPDVPGGLKVGLAHPQGDAVGHAVQQVEVFADAGGGDGLDAAADQLIVVHQSNTNLSSWGS